MENVIGVIEDLVEKVFISLNAMLFECREVWGAETSSDAGLCSTNAQTDVDQNWQACARSDPLELVNFWW